MQQPFLHSIRRCVLPPAEQARGADAARRCNKTAASPRRNARQRGGGPQNKAAKIPTPAPDACGPASVRCKAVAHRPIIYFWHESSGAGQNLLRRRADSTNDHSLQHDFFKRAVSCGIQIGGPIPFGNAARKAAQQGKAHAQHVFRAGQSLREKNGVFRFGQADKFSLLCRSPHKSPLSILPKSGGICYNMCRDAPHGRVTEAHSAGPRRATAERTMEC